MNTVDATCGSRRAICKPTWLSFAVRAMRNQRLILIWLRPPDMGELDHNLGLHSPIRPRPTSTVDRRNR
jgi:hypothetical protein